MRSAVSFISSADDAEAAFITAVGVIAASHECEVVEIDVDRQVINISCPKGNDKACAMELEDVIGTFYGAVIDEPEIVCLKEGLGIAIDR